MRSPLSHGSPPQPRISVRGLTIIELLVVLGVVAVLMSILLPAIGSAQRVSRNVACASNMRQVGVAHHLYMYDSRDWLVNAGLSHGSVPGDLTSSWLSQLTPYMDTHEALRSPTDVSRYWSVDDGGEHEGLTLAQALAAVQNETESDLPNALVSRWTSYAVNILLTDSFGGWPVLLGSGEVTFEKWTRLHAVPVPSRTVQFLMLTIGDVAGDPKFARSDHVDSDGWLDVPPHLPDLALKKAARQSQLHAHGGRPGTWEARANYLYLDGRVEAHSFYEVYESPQRNLLLPIATPPK